MRLSGGATQPFLKDGKTKKLRTDPAIKPHIRVLPAERKLDLHRGSEARQERND